MSDKKPRLRPYGLRTTMELFDIGPLGAIVTLIALAAMTVVSVVYFVRSAPPAQITISTGPDKGVYQRYANRYAKAFEKNGIKLVSLPSKGSKENLERLGDPLSSVDLAFAQAGVTRTPPEGVVSLGSIAYQPLMLFYRGKPIQLISELEGKRVAIGPDGSGVHDIALSILGSNGIRPDDPADQDKWPAREAERASAVKRKPAVALDWEMERAAQALLSKDPKEQIDALFIMGESAPMPLLRQLLRSREIHLYDFKQASAYARRLDYLQTLEFPAGSIDIGSNLPDHDITLVGPIVELVAKNNLHPAISDLILEAARELHGRPGTYQKRGEFPSLQEHTIPLSEDARRFYTSGKTFLYRYLPYWLASLVSRALVAFIPLIVLMIPVMKGILAFFRWRANIKIRRHYRALLKLEERFLGQKDPTQLERLRNDLTKIEESVNRTKIPVAFADQYYGLRWHVSYVRSLVDKGSV